MAKLSWLRWLTRVTGLPSSIVLAIIDPWRPELPGSADCFEDYVGLGRKLRDLRRWVGLSLEELVARGRDPETARKVAAMHYEEFERWRPRLFKKGPAPERRG